MSANEKTAESGEVENPSMEDIQAEIEHTREELAATVDALSHRLDVKARAQEKVTEAKEHVQAKLAVVGEPVQQRCTAVWTQARSAGPSREMSLAAAGVLAMLILIMWRRRRRS